MKKCSFGEDVDVKICGIPVDPCVYQDIEVHKNVTVVVKRCMNCGNIELEWHRQEDTEDFTGDDLE